MTPVFQVLLTVFREQERTSGGFPQPDGRTLREVISSHSCDCPACDGTRRALGILPATSGSYAELELMYFLLHFLEGAPKEIREILTRSMAGEFASGLLPKDLLDTFTKMTEVSNQMHAVNDNTDKHQDAHQKDTIDMDKSIKKKSDNEALDVVNALVDSLQNGTVFKGTKVVKEGEKIIIPEGMSCVQAIDVLQKQAKEDDTKIAVDILVDAYPFEGARAFQDAVAKQFGWVNRVTIPGGFFTPDRPPMMITIDVDVDKTETVMWGRIEIPAIDGYLETDITVVDNRFLFHITGEVKKKSMPLVEKLGTLTKQNVKEFSIYRGKAVRFSFPDPADPSTFDIRNSPKFIDTSRVNPDNLIFSKDIDAQIRRAIFNPIEYTDTCRKLGIPLKRGTLLAGRFGVGKSMASAVTARKCVENGWTFFYLERPDQLPSAIRFARNYQPAVIFVEDVDKVTKGDRNKALDDLLNVIDGVDTKGGEIMMIFTTNQLNVINPAILRAGRLDDIVEVLPPDAEAVARLIHLYARGLLAEGVDATKVAEMLAGQIPATIEDVCTRAQLAAVPRAHEGTIRLTAEDLETSAQGKLRELKLVEVPRPTVYGTSIEKAADLLGAAVIDAVSRVPALPEASNGSKKKLTSGASAS